MLSPTTNIVDIKSKSFVKDSLHLNNKVYQKKLKEVAREFESLLVYEMFKEMNKNISLQGNNSNLEESDALFEKKQAEKIFSDFLTYERGKTAVQSQNLNFGLADSIIKQID